MDHLEEYFNRVVTEEQAEQFKTDTSESVLLKRLQNFEKKDIELHPSIEEIAGKVWSITLHFL